MTDGYWNKEREVDESPYGIEFKHFPTIDSTHTYCEANWMNFDLQSSELIAVSADNQTAGRGTGDRKWEDEEATSVLMTFVFQFPEQCTNEFIGNNVSCLTKVLSLAALEALEDITAEYVKKELCGVRESTIKQPPVFSMKWPNDIILNDKKIGGVLAKCIARKGRQDTIILSIGINVNSGDKFLAHIDRPVWPASSIRAEIGSSFDIAMVRTATARTLSKHLRPFFQDGFAAFHEKCSQREVYTGRQVTFSTGKETLVGTFLGLGASGAILLKTADGKFHELFSGEIIDETSQL